MKFILLFSSLLFGFHSLDAQSHETKKNNIGAELDALPYATGGYFGALWVGKSKWRLRVLTADVNKPDFTTRNGFKNHRIHAYAVVADRFLKQGWKGWWLGGGLVYWKSTIQSDALVQTASFKNYLLNGSAGYNITIYRHIYITPWAGLSLRIAGDEHVKVDQQLYTLPFLNPEVSLKIGIYF